MFPHSILCKRFIWSTSWVWMAWACLTWTLYVGASGASLAWTHLTSTRPSLAWASSTSARALLAWTLLTRTSLGGILLCGAWTRALLMIPSSRRTSNWGRSRPTVSDWLRLALKPCHVSADESSIPLLRDLGDECVDQDSLDFGLSKIKSLLLGRDPSALRIMLLPESSESDTSLLKLLTGIRLGEGSFFFSLALFWFLGWVFLQFVSACISWITSAVAVMISVLLASYSWTFDFLQTRPFSDTFWDANCFRFRWSDIHGTVSTF